MKRKLIAALGLVACANHTFAFGHIYFNNYIVPPYNQVYWNPSAPTVGNQALRDTSVQLQLWYGSGNLNDPNQLTPGASFTIDMSWIANAFYNPNAGHGNGGYYSFFQDLPSWQPGETFTFQLRASGTSAVGPVNGSSVLRQETSSITDFADEAGTSSRSIGFPVNVVPEPSSLAIAGIGSLALVMAKRRR